MKLTPIIARTGSRPYRGVMASAVFRLLALAALILMPFGMGGAASAAIPQIAVAAERHCGDHQKPDDHPAKMDMHCASCSALPASSFALGPSELRPELPRIILATTAISDNELEIATPPPKLG